MNQKFKILQLSFMAPSIWSRNNKSLEYVGKVIEETQINPKGIVRIEKAGYFEHDIQILLSK